MLTAAISNKFDDFADLVQALAPATVPLDSIFPPAFQALRKWRMHDQSQPFFDLRRSAAQHYLANSWTCWYNKMTRASGMLTERTIREDLLPDDGIGAVVATTPTPNPGLLLRRRRRCGLFEGSMDRIWLAAVSGRSGLRICWST